MEQKLLEQNSLDKVDASIDTFINEVKQPTNTAMGTAAPSAADIPNYGIPNVPPPGPAPAEPTVKPGEPYFTQDDAQESAEEHGDSAPAQPQRSKDYKDKVIIGFIAAEEYITSRISAVVAGSDDVSQFGYAQSDKDALLLLLEPFKDMIVEKCPAIVPLLMVYTGMKIDQGMKARKVFKTNKANKAAKEDKGVLQNIANAATAGESKERTRFTINKKGEYTYDRHGKYMKVGEPKELANLNDLQKILENNTLTVVLEAFSITEEYLKDKGIEF